jgi:plasmid stabilization system protein ParE
MARRRYHPQFSSDLRDAVEHFDGISPAIGKRFRAAVREKLGSITDHPELYASISGQIRACRLSRFPYVVLYTVDGDCVSFFSLVLGSSDRTKWFERS